MNSPMKEKDQGHADLEGVDKATFERFLQWIYKGDYSVLDPLEEDYGFTGHYGNTRRPKTTKIMDQIMAHVKLYIFAEEKDIFWLRSFVVDSLENDFDDWKMKKDFQQGDSVGTSDVVGLLGYVYQNTPKPVMVSYDSLRHFLIRQLFSTITEVAQSEEFQAICIENSDLVGDILTQFKAEADAKAETDARVGVDAQARGVVHSPYRRGLSLPFPDM